jgi:spermidine synthase
MNYLRQLYYKSFCNKIINANIDYKREEYEDRNVLESIIFPYVLAAHSPKKILDIGREDYQSFYNDFFKGRELWTMDMDPEREEFGAPGHHVIDNANNVKAHFQDNYFDFILMNGVFGWGLNSEADIQKCFDGIYDILAPGGLFILGYNEEIFYLDKIQGLNKMRHIEFPPLHTHRFTCINGNHTYRFYIKK